MVTNIEHCVICEGTAGDPQLFRQQVWEDRLWRLSTTVRGPLPGFSYLEPKRHIPYITDLDGEESRTFGETIAHTTRVLREVTGSDLVYVYVFGGGIPHLHLHLAPHRKDDALNTQMIRGEIVETKLPSGATAIESKDFPPLAEEYHRDIAGRIRDTMG